MIANFFQSLRSHQTQYLLISGQATVLYGAATFSEDVDLWINPTEENRQRFLSSLRECRARYYKLTPPLNVQNLHFGHGFHFLLPGENQEPFFLDIMGNPPRVGLFNDAQKTSEQMETEWGTIPTVSIKLLVELKKTQRLEDYPIISKLILAWFDQVNGPRETKDFLWALENTFTFPELTRFFQEHPEAVGAARYHGPEAIEDLGRRISSGTDIPESLEREVGDFLQRRISDWQAADRHYWRGIIAQLKLLRANGGLMPEGLEVVEDDSQTWCD